MLAKRVGIPLLVEQVGIDLGSAPQVLADHRLNVAQQQRRKAWREGFRAVPLMEPLDDDGERSTGVEDFCVSPGRETQKKPVHNIFCIHVLRVRLCVCTWVRRRTFHEK